jgi:C-terminal processing protease CtpA/Prc
LQNAVVRGLAGTDPQAAAQYLAQMNGGANRDNALETVAGRWGEKDTKAALDWAATLPTPQEREAALANVRKVAPVGIGAVLAAGPDGYPVINDVIPGGAAGENPQLGKGAQIAAVHDANGNVIDLHGKNLEETVNLLRGVPGTAVTMEVIPSGGSAAARQVVVLTRRQLLFKR